jgi:hypothetical protein
MTNITAKIIPATKKPKTVLMRLIESLVSGDLISIIECPYALLFEMKLNIIKGLARFFLFSF